MYEAYLEKAILRICSQPRTFEYISKNLSGLDPTVVNRILRQLVEKELVVSMDGYWVIKEVSTNKNLELYPNDEKIFLQKYMGYFDFLKTPHPLDFEWRNSTKSLHRLLNRLTEINNPHDKILLLGMPTLFATAIQKDVPNQITLIERNKPIVQSLTTQITDKRRFNIYEADIFKIEPASISDHFCVVMDPPWYTEHFKQFMWLAASKTELGGIVIISLPPINTRPSVPEERIDWFSYCNQLGLCLETLAPQQLQYSMPFFEFNALRAAGITDILPFWRNGDLAIFRKIDQVKISRPTIVIEENSWIEKEYNTVRIRVKNQNDVVSCEDGALEISHLVPNDILPTVSARHEKRKLANMMTSGNRIFAVNHPKRFLHNLELLTQGKYEDTQDYRSVEKFMTIIADLEKREYKDFITWIYYEMERQTD
ncbi:hypothetical protein [Chitinophaga sp. GbtcB8]|uniref:hypothetical protein n=1 Tax=Chitinophaga sp. GbtcB8 TaxID=2824753 RepID=UPI001C305F0E|nr:hypothetical protein [Chitinophaga sp. GbtcB8]